MILSGSPLSGNDRKKLEDFLAEMNLTYDEGIEHSICILNEENEIIGTGSVDRNVLKCIAMDPEYRGRGLSASILSELIQYVFEQGRSHIFIYTKPENRDLFGNMGFYTILQTEEILFMENRRDGFERFLQNIKAEMPMEAVQVHGADRIVGGIVANCNPFTLGHRYLIEEALKQCDVLHLFLLSDDRGIFTPQERYEMVQRGICGLKNVILHWTSDYMVSAATFPTYFFKDKAQGQKANCQLDLALFSKRIAPELGISKRFVGTEPNCAVTAMYNREMKRMLPQYGIEVVEIVRRTAEGTAISASFVRKCIESRDFARIKSMVPESVYHYLEAPENDRQPHRLPVA